MSKKKPAASTKKASLKNKKFSTSAEKNKAPSASHKKMKTPATAPNLKTKATKKTSSATSVSSSATRSAPTPSTAKKKSHNGFSNFLVWLGILVITAGIIYFIIPEPEDQQPLDNNQNNYNSSGLSDEQLAASIPTQFNTQTGTVNENLGSTVIVDDDETATPPSPLAPLAETGLQELSNLQDTAITSSQEQITQIGSQVNYTTSSIIDRLGQAISGFISWGRNWLFGKADELNLPSPEPIPTPTPDPIPTPTVEVLEVNTIAVPIDSGTSLLTQPVSVQP